MRGGILFGLSGLLLTGCVGSRTSSYQADSRTEKQAYSAADRSITPAMVAADLQSYLSSQVAWAGIIRDVQFRETERTVQVAFMVEYHAFDWRNHGGGTPFRLKKEAGPMFLAGWTVNKPTRIDYLRAQADIGDMLIVYGRPFRLQGGSVQLAASAVRPVKAGDYRLADFPQHSSEPEDQTSETMPAETAPPPEASDLQAQALKMLDAMNQQ